MITKYEARGILISVGVMALILAYVGYDQSVKTDTTSKPDSDNRATVIVAEEEIDGENTALANAIIEASTQKGELTQLVIKDIKIGEGDQVVKEGDTLTVDYIGATQDGVQFDSSYGRGTPFVFTVGDGLVIEGWEKGLIGMKAGGQRIL